MQRYLEPLIAHDLGKKMVFIGGPRQVGKTTLAHRVAQGFANPTLLNWDSREDKAKILANAFRGGSKLLVFDEIHKYSDWKNHLKGLYDTRKADFSILVTGSARLDLYQKGGDSLLGRYFYYRLHPLSLAELMGRIPDVASDSVTHLAQDLQFSDAPDLAAWQDLIRFGGFPEVYLAKDARDLRRWHNDREKRLIQEDIRDASNVRDIQQLALLAALLPSRVGSLFSVNSMARDLNVHHATLTHWMELLEQMYFCYRLYPLQSTLIKSLRKEPKAYLWDYTGIEDGGAKAENIIANHLLKYVHFLSDVHGLKAQLHFVRDQQQREVDFAVVIDGELEMLIEVKSNASAISPHLRYFADKLKPKRCYQLVMNESETPADLIDEDRNGIRVMHAAKFVSALV